MRHRGTPVSRDALYEEVWSDPVTVVALRYGLSDVGLIKICKRMSVPVPTRGYWAKLKSGQVVGKTPSLPCLRQRAASWVPYRLQNKRRPHTYESARPYGNPEWNRRPLSFHRT
jgi:hypothetical protein